MGGGVVSGDPGPRQGLTALGLLRFAVRAVRITASTIAVVALLRQEWVAGGVFAAAWLVILQAPRLFPLLQEPEPPANP